MNAQWKEIPQIRCMLPADLDGVIAVEHEVFLFPWTHRNFSDSLNAGYHCRVLEQSGHIFGYGVMTIGADEAHLLTLSIAAGWQRQGWGEMDLFCPSDTSPRYSRLCWVVTERTGDRTLRGRRKIQWLRVLLCALAGRVSAKGQ